MTATTPLSEQEKGMLEGFKPDNETQLIGNDIKYNFQYPKGDVPEPLPVLDDYEFSVSYLKSKGPRRRKRIIH